MFSDNGLVFQKRLHLFEFCDQSWFAGWMREGFMDCLSLFYRVFRPYHPFAQQIADDLRCGVICDLATGGGESIEFFLKYLEKKRADTRVKIIGTDLCPDVASLEVLKERYKCFDYTEHSVDALALPDNADNCDYTMFTAIHHFKEDRAVMLIRSVLEKGRSLSVFEFTSRYDPLSYIFLLFGVPFSMLAPFFAKKRRWQKFLFSFIPVIPLIVAYDGFVSNLRTYTKEELTILAQNAFPDQRVAVEFFEKRVLIVFKCYMCRFSIQHDDI